MFFDLNVLWQGQVAETQHTLSFLDELGYNTVALTHVLSGKLPADLSCPIPRPLPFDAPSKLRVLRRCTLLLSDPSQNYRLQQLSANYDILALRPTNDKSLLQACQSLDCDIISLDLTARFDSYLKMKSLAQAIERGIKFEICYAHGLTSGDSNARRNLLGNATQLIRATRGRGLILSSEAHRAISCRAPADVINLAAVWGLGPERGKDAIDKLPRSTIASAELKRTSYRGAISIIAPAPDPVSTAVQGHEPSHRDSRAAKRKAENQEDVAGNRLLPEPQVSKRALKRQRKALLALNAEASVENGNET